MDSLNESRTLRMRDALSEEVDRELEVDLDYRPDAIEECPYCGSLHIVKRGHDQKQRQRHLCKACHRSFTGASAKPLSSSKLPKETWQAFIDCLVLDMPLRASADKCNVSLKTAHYMKARLFRVLP